MDIGDRLSGLTELLHESNSYILRMDSLMRRVESTARNIQEILSGMEIPPAARPSSSDEGSPERSADDLSAALRRIRKDHGKLTRVVRGLVATTTQTEGSLPIVRRIEEINKAKNLLIKQWEDRNTLMNELRRAHEELVSLDEMKSHFIDVASHELRTPISTMQGFLELLERGAFGTLSERQASVVAVLFKNVRRLSFLVLNMVNLQMLGRGTINMRHSDFDLRVLTEGVVDEIEAFLAQRKQQLGVRIAPDAAIVTGNPEGIRTVLMNLVLNAIRFTPDGGRIDITAEARSSGDVAQPRCRIGVSDTGIGIPDEEQSRIFQSFYEVMDPAHHHSGLIEFQSGGLGLGLTIVAKILQDHHTDIGVSSKVGKGSTFSFELPLAEAGATALALPEDPGGPDAADTRG
ncbi:MAG: hypothetical protein HYV63_18425 [Candidatus Schekmanbacteria bacterium]|nr:hypothetical protein [Candidatus Schekmanbacteria bacterium]